MTELIHRSTFERSLKAIELRKAGKETTRPEAYFVWDRDALLCKLQALIDAKDQPSKQKGGPYQGYVLVIHTAECFLDRGTVNCFLEGASFRATFITDVFLGLPYLPSAEREGGCYPVFAYLSTTHDAFVRRVEGRRLRRARRWQGRGAHLLPRCSRAAGPPLDVGERPQRRHTTSGARLLADARGGDGGVREESAARLSMIEGRAGEEEQR